MENVEVILVLLLLAVVVLSAAARAINVPYPIVLVVGGALLGLSGGLPEIELDPDLVLVIFLPPLLYSGAFFANLQRPARATCARSRCCRSCSCWSRRRRSRSSRTS